MSNVYLLNQAAEFPEKDSLKRLIYATLFTVVHYNLQKNKTKKPFNPLLGETYEMV